MNIKIASTPRPFKAKAVTAATAVMVYSSALYEYENFLSSNFEEITMDSDVSYSNTLNLENINQIKLSTHTKTEIISNFVKNLSMNTKDLDYRIVDLVNDNFWDLV